eukprot:2651594-Prorocentrum_lima.AAC.1
MAGLVSSSMLQRSHSSLALTRVKSTMKRVSFQPTGGESPGMHWIFCCWGAPRPSSRSSSSTIL